MYIYTCRETERDPYHVYIYIYIHTYTERERERERKRSRYTEGGGEHVEEGALLLDLLQPLPAGAYNII